MRLYASLALKCLGPCLNYFEFNLNSLIRRYHTTRNAIGRECGLLELVVLSRVILSNKFVLYTMSNNNFQSIYISACSPSIPVVNMCKSVFSYHDIICIKKTLYHLFCF